MLDTFTNQARWILIFLQAAFLSACQTEKNPEFESSVDPIVLNQQVGLVQKYGIYHSKDSNLVLDIHKKNDILEFWVKNKKGKILVKSPKNLTINENWAIFLDDNNNIWLHSTDIGDFEWIEKNSCYFKKKLSDDMDSIHKFPVDFQNVIDP